MSFSGIAKGWVERTKARVEKVTRTVAIKLFSAVVKSTPFLTGRLAGNWQTTIASPALGIVEVQEGETSSGVKAKVVQQIVAVVSSFSGDGVLILVNNLPYAYRIEYEGYSKKKAPEGMVRINVLRISRIVSDAINEGKL